MLTFAEKKDIQQNIDGFTGTENYYRNSLFRFIGRFTEGVKYVRDACKAQWLLCLIDSLHVRGHRWESFTLKVNADGTATMTVDDGNGNILDSRKITYTDFPLPEVKMWLIDGVLLLPSEY